MRGAGRPVWDDLASDEDMAALAPEPPAALPSRPDVLVIGGGAVGLCVAASCTSAGMEVVLVEREPRLASGPSGRAAGGLAPDAHPELGPGWRALARRSLALHAELDSGLGYGLRTTDLLVLPDLVIADQGHVDPLRFCAALARRAGTVVVGTDPRNLRVRAEHLVHATGAAPEAAGVAAQSMVKGHLVATEPLPHLLDTIVTSVRDDVLAVQMPCGRVVCGGTKEPGETSSGVDADVVARIGKALDGICGREASITHSWTCFRPLAGTGSPVVAQLADGAWCAAGFYSTGILMAPVAGDLIARAIAGEQLPADVAP